MFFLIATRMSYFLHIMLFKIILWAHPGFFPTNIGHSAPCSFYKWTALICCNYLSYSSPCVKIKKILSIYLNHNTDWWLWVFKQLVSIWSIKIHVHGWGNLAPIAVPDICWKTLLNSKKLFFNTNWAILTSLSVEICLRVK